MSENTLFKKSYTRQEIEECFQWLEQHIDSLPTSMRLSPSIRSCIVFGPEAKSGKANTITASAAMM